MAFSLTFADSWTLDWVKSIEAADRCKATEISNESRGILFQNEERSEIQDEIQVRSKYLVFLVNGIERRCAP